MKITIILLLSIIFIGSCTYKKIDALNNACITTNITYTNTVQKIMSDFSCSTTGCHGGTQGPDLATYEQVKTATADSNFMGSIKHLSNYSAMPKSAAKMDDCNIQKIEAWIAGGMAQ